MVDRQIRTFDVTDQVLLARILEVPRELFLPPDLAAIAYCDKALVVGGEAGERRSLLPPMILARLLQAGAVQPGDKALDVGGGGGYGAAILAGLAESVVCVESSTELTNTAKAGFEALALRNAQAATGPLADAAGHPGPFDVILVNGAVECALEPLLARLAPGGRLLAILRDASDPTGKAARAVQWRRTGGEVGVRPLFNASAPVLREFARKQEFAF